MTPHFTTLYVKREGRLYCISAYHNATQIKRQTNNATPAADGMIADPADEYDGLSWDMDALAILVDKYEAHLVTVVNAKIAAYSDHSAPTEN